MCFAYIIDRFQETKETTNTIKKELVKPIPNSLSPIEWRNSTFDVAWEYNSILILQLQTVGGFIEFLIAE